MLNLACQFRWFPSLLPRPDASKPSPLPDASVVPARFRESPHPAPSPQPVHSSPAATGTPASATLSSDLGVCPNLSHLRKQLSTVYHGMRAFLYAANQVLG
jgi:hypothetical protein